MIQIGIRLHDVNSQAPSELQTLEARAAKAREEGFRCVHLALSKCIKGVSFDSAALNEGLAAYVRRIFREQELDVAVLGCYLKMACENAVSGDNVVLTPASASFDQFKNFEERGRVFKDLVNAL